MPAPFSRDCQVANEAVIRESALPNVAEALQKRKVIRILAIGASAMAGRRGRPGTYTNVLGQHGVLDLFDVLTVSELVGCEKPDPRMFVAALDQLGIPRADYGRTVMVGNNLERDIKGANLLGMVSIWIDWAPRRSKTPANALEVPAFTVKLPLEVLPVIERLERDCPPGTIQPTT